MGVVGRAGRRVFMRRAVGEQEVTELTPPAFRDASRLSASSERAASSASASLGARYRASRITFCCSLVRFSWPVRRLGSFRTLDLTALGAEHRIRGAGLGGTARVSS